MNTPTPYQPPPSPDDRVDDQDRQIAVEQIQRAMASDAIRFEELDERFEKIYAADTRGELELALHGLPLPPPPKAPTPRHPLAPVSYSIFGDIKVGGWVSVGSEISYGSGFGDVLIDLSSAHLSGDCTVRVYSIFGDVTVILPDGVRANLQSTTIFGDRKELLHEAVRGAPYVRVVAATLFGDAKLYSLSMVPEGRFRKLWRALRGN
ncbi:MAG: DUF1707 domain-containing protein [Acidimicrobiales bacterium]